MVKQSPRKLRLGFFPSLRAFKPQPSQPKSTYAFLTYAQFILFKNQATGCLQHFFSFNLHLKYEEHSMCRPPAKHQNT